MKLTIRSSEWGRGKKPGHFTDSLSCLEDPKTGRKCCLGILGKQLGARLIRSDGDTVVLPSRLDAEEWEKFSMAGLGWLGQPWRGGQRNQTVIADINDDSTISDEKRLRQLREEFGKHGIEIEYIDDEKEETT